MEGFWLQIIVSKAQRGNGEAEVHKNSAPLFFTATEAVYPLNIIKPKNDEGIKY